MNEITCPKCDTSFAIDKAGFANIVKQVRDREFEKELRERLNLAEKEKDSAIKLAEADIKNSLQKELVAKDALLAELKAKTESELVEKMSVKEMEISEMKSKIQNIEKEKDSAIKLAEADIKNSLQKELAAKDALLAELKAKSEAQLVEKMAEKEMEISEMKSQIQNVQTAKQLEILEVTKRIEKERDRLLSDLKIQESEKALLKKSIEEQFNTKLMIKDETIRMREDEIERLRNFKQKLSTKMVGESLEQHCEIEFSKLRAIGFQSAYFEKDNDVSGGTKGDYIYKEEDEEGNEIISIMFEMKNENEETATKKRNEDFFAKLDKDRNEKNCEYAVLVSLLEGDNDLYNSGIVDVSHKFEKMYVVRPQFFIPIITLLRNAAMKSMEYKAELNMMRNQNVDISNFEDKIMKFKEGFEKNYSSASKHFEQAIQDIDKSIKSMEKVKKELTTSQNQLRLANQKAEGLTIKKLTHGNPTMKARFDAEK